MRPDSTRAQRLPPARQPRSCSQALAIVLCAWASAWVSTASVAGAASLSGQVTTAPDDLPLQGALVVAYDLRLAYQTTLADVQGDWRFDDLPAGPVRIRVISPTDDPHVSRYYRATRDYCSAELLWLDEDSQQAGLNVSLEEGGALQGVLQDQQGQPVEGAVITAQGVDADVAGLSRTTTTDSTGGFTLRGLDATASQATQWICQVSVTGWPDQYLAESPAYDSDDAQVYSVEAQQELDVGSIRLLDGIGLSGTVTGPEGPAPGATVYAYSGSQILTVTTDDSGRYDAVGLPPGQALVWVTGDGLASTYYPDQDRPADFIEVPNEGALYDGLDLSAAAEATLLASFSGAGAGVRAMLYNSTYTVGKGSSSDDKGVVTLTGLYGGAYTLYAWGYPVDLVNGWVTATGQVSTQDTQDLPQTIDILEGQENHLSIDLGPGGRLSGSLVDDAGLAVYGASIYVTPVNGDTTSTTSDLDGSWSIGGLPAGDWLIEVSYGAYCSADPGYVSLVWPGQPAADQAELLTIAAGEQRDQLNLVLPRDDDHDGMSDQWEQDWGLDPDRDDSQEDPDGDGLSNLEEYLLGTDPLSKDGSGGCGCTSLPGSSKPPGLWLLVASLLGISARRRRPDRSTPRAPAAT